jgi:hypothetical protein
MAGGSSMDEAIGWASEMKSAGVLLATESLKSSAGGARLRMSGGKQSWDIEVDVLQAVQ